MSPLSTFRRSVQRDPELTAIAYFDGRLSYREVDELSDGVANHPLAEGFRRGDRLAIVLQNIPQFVLALLGAWKAGGIVVPVNPMYRERELTHVLSDAGVRAVVCSQSGWNAYVSRVLAESSVRISLTTSELDLQERNDSRVFGKVRRELTEGAADLLEVARAKRERPRPTPAFTSGEVALISYTSGTSGTPKGATNTHGNIATSAAALSGFSGLAEGCALFGLAPLFHITGMVCEVASAMDIGGTLVLAYRFEPGVVLDAFLESKPVYTVGPSTAYMALMAHPDVTHEHFTSFHLLYSGGAALPPAVVETFRERFGHFGHYITTATGRLRQRQAASRFRAISRLRSTLSRARSRSACRCPVRSSESSTTRAPRCRPAWRARSSSKARWSFPATGTGRRRPRPRCPEAACSPATSDSWTPTAGSTWWTARRT
jgi:long-chain acyl-CoA synthetase